MCSSTMDDHALRILRSVFGYEHFRAPQAEVIATLVAGGDALVLMPTGGGKSLCFQIPAIVRPGTGIVISPLIALMQEAGRGARRFSQLHTRCRHGTRH
jgi:ATP-dependent DNA helicase RecQ